MTVLVIAVLLLTAASGLLWWRVLVLRRQLRDARDESSAGAVLETEKLAILHEAVEVLRQKNQHLQNRLDQSQEELGSLVYSISHDLRAPLRSINGFSQALSEDYGPRLDATAQDYLRRVRSGATYLNTLIDELLALSRIVRAPFHAVTVDLSGLAWEVVSSLTAEEPMRRVEWDIQPGLTAWGDRDLLGLALRHLLGNAWKFSAGRAVAHVSFRRVAETPALLTYEVRDDGAGFDSQYAGRLFGIFQRMHTADEFAGHGTGLAAARRIFRRHGGDIHASSEPGQGAVFTFTLDSPSDSLTAEPPISTRDAANTSAVVALPPSKPKAHRRMSDNPAPAAGRPASNKLILLVEDNPDDEALTLRALARNGIRHQVHVARDGVEALDYLFAQGKYADRDRSQMPTVTLLDLKLPRIDGLEVLRRLRAEERTRFLPVVILTSSREEQDLIESYSQGVNSYIRKPVDFVQFTEAVRQVGAYWLVLNEDPPRS